MPSDLPRTTSRRRWTEEQLSFLLLHYPEKGEDWCSEHMPGVHYRSAYACTKKYNALTGKPPATTFWTLQEMEFLRDHYPVMGAQWCAEMLDRTYSAVKRMANKHRIEFFRPKVATLEDIKANCFIADEEDACWEWKGAKKQGVPYHHEHSSLRQSVWLMSHTESSVKEFKRSLIRPICGNPACLNPEHLRLVSKKSLYQSNFRKSRKLAAMRSLGAKIKAGHTKLDFQKACFIRASDLPSTVLAEQFGVTESSIQRVRNGTMWNTGLLFFPSPSLFSSVAQHAGGRTPPP